MPQLIGVLLLAGLGYYAWRVYKREAARVEQKLAEKRAARNSGKSAEVLEEDPETGVYRPRESKD